MPDFLTLQVSSAHPALLTVLYTVLLAFLLSTLIGFTYIRTFRGLSFSRNYVQSLILGSIVAATVMQAIGDSLAHGLGMLGALAIIRFRTTFKDSRDILFMFASLAAGISCGVGGYVIGVVGTLGFIVIALVLASTPLGGRSAYDGLLRGNMDQTDDNRRKLDEILVEYCHRFVLITLRDMQQGNRFDFAYHVKIRKNKGKEQFLLALTENIPTLRNSSLMLQETTVEL